MKYILKKKKNSSCRIQRNIGFWFIETEKEYDEFNLTKNMIN